MDLTLSQKHETSESSLLFTVIGLCVTMRPNMLLKCNSHYKSRFSNSLHWHQPGWMNLRILSWQSHPYTILLPLIVPFIIAALAVVHLLFLHGTGSNNPTGISSDMNKIPFHPYYTVKDNLGALFLFLFSFFLFIYFCLCWVFFSVRGLSLVVASGGHSSSRCAGLSLSRPLLLRSTGSRRAGSVVVAHGPSRSAACGMFPDQGSNPCPLHWQADSQPLRHQGSPSSDATSSSTSTILTWTSRGPKQLYPS